MNEKEYRKVIEALVKVVERLSKTSATPAHCEAMAKVADALVELHKLNVRERTSIRSGGTTNSGN